MASRKSGHYDSEQYVGTRRGRRADGDMGFEMFPEKYEKTAISEDPAEMYNYFRETLKDYEPDHGNMLASDEARRNTYARDRLNLRSGGARVTTEPYANEDFDTQFHDEDPRGWSSEQPWDEYRRVMRAQMERIDYKDDGDYSVTGGGIHPNSLYKNIRGAQNWVKARLKIFSTSKDNFHNGGIGKYKWHDKSSVEKVDFEETSVNIDQRYDSFDERTNKTSLLSNIVNLGSKALRVNTTTDQEVTVSAYGKLMRHMGLLNHETQLRIVEDDTKWGREFKGQAVVKPLVDLMSSAVEGATSAAAGRLAKQDTAGDSGKYGGSRIEKLAANRNQKLTGDIIALMGFTQDEVKRLDAVTGPHRKTADLALAQLHGLTEMLHATPAGMKLAMRDELALAAVHSGVRTGDGGRAARNDVILNPKIKDFMQLMAKKNADRTANPEELMRSAIADSEGKLGSGITGLPALIYKTGGTGDVDPDSNRRDTETIVKKSAVADVAAASYKTLAMKAQQIANNRGAALQMQELDDSVRSARGQNMAIGSTLTNVGDVNTTAIDNAFGENKSLTRHGGRIGTKHMVRHMDTDTSRDEMSDSNTSLRKNRH
jgi:hypothetical protein